MSQLWTTNNSIETMRSLEKEKDLLELGSIANEVNVSLLATTAYIMSMFIYRFKAIQS